MRWTKGSASFATDRLLSSAHPSRCPKKTSRNACFKIQVFITVLTLCGFAVSASALPIFEEPVFFQKPAPLSPQDRQQLKKIASLKTTASVRAVRVELPLLRPAEPGHGQPVGFNVEHDSVLSVMMKSQTQLGQHSYIWRGSIVDDQGGQVTLVVNRRKVTGMIRWGSEIYAVEPLTDGNHALIHIDPSQYPPEYPAGPDDDGAKAPQTGTPSLVVPAVPDLWAGERNLFQDKAMRLAVDEANHSYQNSNIPITLAGFK
ncbi:MAG: hypothetical protein EPN21_16940 [Methylococcaceae bacterium]|nr:MAG: hypothetical protein EPN21_16940 [Methylococcaceae bacterium]